MTRPETARPGWARLLAILALITVALAAALAAGTLPRWRREHAVNSEAAEATAAAPRVAVATVHRAARNAERVLPGNTLPWLEASLYARATGYIKERKVDIGDRVEQGQVLAVIDAPDLDDQLEQAKANLEQAKATLRVNEANAALAETTLARSRSIRKENVGAISQQLLDEQSASVGATGASVEAAKASILVNEATVRRYTDLQRFEKITAPFPGVITARQIDPGDLVSADATTRELFHLMRTDVLRVFVSVPQTFATGVKLGQTATVFRREEPGKQFAGKVARTTDALDSATRTLLTEVDVPNPENALRPGMYLQVKFVFDARDSPLMIPTAALATRSRGSRVAVLDEGNHVRYRDVELGRDFGAEVQVLSGVNEGDRVVVHPGDDLPDGTAVEPVPEK